jgi:hypothetical protein
MLNSYSSHPELFKPPLPGRKPAISLYTPAETQKTVISTQGSRPGSSSQDKSARIETSPEKRVRLRDYLFFASTSSMRNNERRKSLKQNMKQPENPSQRQSLQSSMSLLRRQKYDISNLEMYRIVKKEIQEEYLKLIRDMQQKIEILGEDDNPHPTNDDLVVLYNIRRLINDRIHPANKDVDQLFLKKEAKLVR